MDRGRKRRTVSFLSLAALSGALLAGPTPAGATQSMVSWPQYRFGANRAGANPFETVLSPSNVSGLHVIWTASTGGPIESSPAVVNGTLFIGSDDHNVYAFDVATGTQKWMAATGAEVFGSPAVGAGRVFDTSGDNHLYAFDAATGATLWSTDLGGVTPTQTSPALVGRFLFATSGTQTVFAVDARTGAVRWSRNLISLGCALDSGYSPALALGVLYQSGCSIPLTALKAATGAFVWTGGAANSGPAVAGGVAYYPTSQREMRAANASTGAVLWATPGPATGIELDYPAISGGIVYQASYDQAGNPGYLTAWDAGSGALLWTTTLPCGATDTSPTVANGVVYVSYGFSCPNGLAAIDAATGAILFSTSFGGGSFEMRSSPTVVNGMVYVGTDLGTVVALGL